MIDKKYFNSIRNRLAGYIIRRRDIIKSAGDIQHWSKKSIFAIQRDDLVLADELLAKAGQQIKLLTKKYKTDAKVLSEGSYRACLEEYAEAVIMRQFISDKKIGRINGLDIDESTYISGLCDVPGELLRYAIKSATERDFAMVKKCFQTVQEIINETLDMNLTGYNRQKFDQAKQALHKLQQIFYEVSLKSAN
ncbi:MAG: hypothetical protein COU31_04660 [Candidatus Magasanikbacteria bacterium CG10_big_fil_rev_8_21_14_0_10_40_10]|uniref:Haloacid dehalogenase n=1 Tax=Candidatus Magasanikbacteria bacterium CG10_big_fil_rev_8_21_14_0_10_40_10 TaxID=1974648 RepID=A0A2M6W2T3_9BACT|nr:MAG: hypothetical protein COU31_04660 [Candidatus Magasanikbacteria bacterium CG10_big_fil_rev_8_21_14_0_10_40_10]